MRTVSRNPAGSPGDAPPLPRPALVPAARPSEAADAEAADGGLGCLALAELRAYRRDLAAEEGRVSYWRRLVQARLDVLRSGATGGPGAVERLGDVLVERPAASRRRAHHATEPAAGALPLPGLAALWAATAGDPAAAAALRARLAAAERELSRHRADLHDRLDAATAELVARYRAEPGSCLVALPPARRDGTRA